MFDAFLIFLTVLSAVIVAKFILKKYNAIFVFFASGVVILMCASLLTGTSILGKATLGNVFLDTFGFITKTFKSNISGIGTIIMVVTGYAAYMKHVGASTKLAYLASKPLSKIKNRYLVLSGVFIIGMALKLVLTSQASLAVLMLATVFPILIALRITPMTAASTLALLCLDYGPNDGSTLFMANIAQMNVVDLFILYQSKVALCIIIVTAIVMPFYYSYMDKKDKETGNYALGEEVTLKNPDIPVFYAFLPIVPLAIIFVAYFIPTVKIDVITANVLGFAVTFICEFIRRVDRKEIPKDMVVILKAMGDIFVSVVSIIISASVFAEGIKILGGITIFTNLISEMHGAVLIVMVLLTGITFAFAVIMGSGAAPFFAFGPLTPEIAEKLGVPTLTLLLPMELATALGRASSPVCGALIAVAGVANIAPMSLAKRTAPLLVLGLIVNIIASYIFTI
ncbi:C4-dicarboxylate transporter DcuC [Anaerosinus massiliensis]|uniref:C4-dicarboxylate transporter DcuC n=1 Tax=Massilibacillus massiliensis TaxID=1806837 RepID=UPI000B2AA809|nr:C4-dicarboxylate transporter DcuC [Massilibacillus massiliensis]